MVQYCTPKQKKPIEVVFFFRWSLAVDSWDYKQSQITCLWCSRSCSIQNLTQICVKRH